MSNDEATSSDDAISRANVHSVGRTSRLSAVLLILAIIWLLVCVAAGGLLIKDAGSQTNAMAPPTQPMKASSDLVTYGGDAYTGIQNAAAETERAVVDGFNAELTMQQSLAVSRSKSERQNSERIQQGIGFLIICAGVLTFVAAAIRRPAR